MLASWLRNTFRRARVEQDLDDEMQAYVDLVADEKSRAGMPAAEARRAALLEMGGIEQVKERVRDIRAGAWLEDFTRDLRSAVRSLLRRPAFTAVATVTLALGIGATTSIASLVYALFEAKLPLPEPDRLVRVFQTQPPQRDYYYWSYVDYAYFRDHARSFSHLAASYAAPLHFAYGGESAALYGGVASPNYFETLGVRPVAGRFFLPTEGSTPGKDQVAVISYALWRDRFGQEPDIAGRVIKLNGTAFTVIGVAPPELRGTEFGRNEMSVWILSSMFRVGYRYCDGLAPGCELVQPVGRLAPGVGIAQAQAELATLARQIEIASPNTNRGRGVMVLPARGAHPQRLEQEGETVRLLGVAVCLVLLIVCANLAGLLASRNLTRARETALRLSLGAGRSRVIRELLTESLPLGLVGGGLGIGVAVLFNQVVLRFYGGPHTYFTLALSPTVLAASTGVTLFTVLAFGLGPALRASRVDLLAILKSEGRSAASGRSRLRDALVVAQSALSLVLLVDASLLIRSLRHLYQGERFDPRQVVMMRLRPTLVGYDVARSRAFEAEVHRRLEATPGVVAASPASYAATWKSLMVTAWPPNRAPTDPEEAPRFPANRVGPRFFKVLGVRPLAGREFDERDVTGRPAVAIVNQALANRFWPAGNAVGQELVVAGVSTDVIGVVPDLEYRGAGRPADPFVYLSYWQADTSNAFAAESRTHVLVSGDPGVMLPRLRRVVAQVDPDVPINEEWTLVAFLGDQFRQVRLATTLLGYFGGFALLLSALGTYGMLSFRVTQRTHEIGVRMALGADRGRVSRQVLGRGIGLALAGFLIGSLGAWASVRLLGSMLYGVAAGDPVTIALAPLLLVGVAAAASYLPARRAARLDPLLALRHE